MDNRPECYSLTMRALHWGIAILIAANTGLGLYLGSLDGTAAESWYDLHKSTGVIIFALVALRLLRRFGYEVAPALPPMPRWQERAARATHVGLYVLMVLIPLTGYLGSSAAGFPTHVFGLATIPAVLAEDRPAYDAFREMHCALNRTAVVLIGLHVTAVLKHRFVDGRGILSRML